jgi:hypothetical protein
MILGIDILPSIETENFLLEGKELMRLIKPAEKFWGNLESFPGFGKVTIFASFRGVGK